MAARRKEVKWRTPRSEPAWRRPKGAAPALAQSVAQVQVDVEEALERTVALQDGQLVTKAGAF